MATYRVSDFTRMYREENPDLEELKDTDILHVIAKRDPELFKYVDRDELQQTMREGRKESISRERQKQFKSLSGADRFSVGAGASVLDIYNSVKQAVGGDTKDYEETKKIYKESSEGDLASGLGELAGSMAMTAPFPAFTGAKLATKVASPLIKTAIKLGTGALTGAGTGATEFVDDDETRATNAAFGALFGAGGTGAGLLIKKVGTKGYNALKEKYKTADIQELMKLSKQYDIPISYGDITGKGQNTEKALRDVPIVGMGRHFDVGTEKTKAVLENIDNSIDKDWSDRLQQSLKSKLSEAKAEAKINYDQVEKLSGGARVVPQKTIDKIDEKLASFKDNFFSTNKAFVQELKRTRNELADSKLNYSKLRANRQSLGEQARDAARTNDIEANVLREIRGAVEQDMDAVVEQQVKSMTERKGRAVAKAIENTTFLEPSDAGVVSKKILGDEDKEFVKQKMLEEADKQFKKGQELKTAYAKATKQYREDVVPFKDDEIANILKTDKPDEVYSKFVKPKLKDKTQKLYDRLDESGRKALRDGFLDNALRSKQGEELSAGKFAGYLEKMTAPSTAIFKGKDLEELKGLAKIMRHAEVYTRKHDNPSNGVQLIPLLKGALISGTTAGAMVDPVTTGVTVGSGALLTALSSFMRTKGKGLLLASDEIGNEKTEKLITEFIKQLPKATSVTAKEIEE